MVEDFRVKALSDEEIESIALNWRKALSNPGDPAPDVLGLIRKAGAEYKHSAGLEVVA